MGCPVSATRGDSIHVKPVIKRRVAASRGSGEIYLDRLLKLVGPDERILEGLMNPVNIVSRHRRRSGLLLGADDLVPVEAGAVHVATDQFLAAIDVARLDGLKQFLVIVNRCLGMLAPRK